MSDADALDDPDTEASPAVTQVRLPTASDSTRATHVEPPGTNPAAVRAEPDPTETRTPTGSQDPTASARSWLASRGTGGLALITLLRSIADGERPAEILAPHDRHLLIPYPEGLTALVVPGIGMEPADVLHALWDGGLLAIDPRRPLLRVREIDGRMRAMLTVEASAAVATLLESVSDRVPVEVLGVAPEADIPSEAEAAIEAPAAQPGATALAPSPPKPPPRRSAARAFAEDLAAQCLDGRVPTTALPIGLLIDHATLAALAAEHRIPPSKLLRRLKHQPDFLPDTRGIILAGRP
jgi:conjugal transfer pilus assembly protein TraI